MPRKFLEPQAASNPMRSLQSMYRRPTIFLGLGGTGCHAVASVKLLFERTFADYAKEGARGVIPAGFQFLGFDSAQTDCPAALISGQEWIKLSAKITSTTMAEIREEEFYRDWIPNVDAWDFATGAGGMRALGRLLFTRNMALFARHFGAKLQTAAAYNLLDSGEPVIYVFAGLAGGTGSGALLDACFYLRQNYPDARIIGLLGVVAGEQGKPQDIQINAAVGCHAALREINTFQDAELRAKLGDRYAAEKVFSYPVGGHHGKYTRPFDNIFLIGNRSQRGITNLIDARSLTAFMARTAFMLTAYPADSKGGARTFDSEMCDYLAAASAKLNGGLATYLVPGFGQLRLPGELTADYLTCSLGGGVVNALRGGSGYEPAKFTRFVAAHRLHAADLGSEVAYDNAGKKLVATDWMGELRTSMEKPRVRYSDAGREEILSYGQGLGTTYLSKLKAEMAGRAAAVVATHTSRIHDEVIRCLKDPALRLVGAGAFLIAVRAHVASELRHWDGIGRKERDDGLTTIKSDWSAIKRLVADVCTDSGPVDRVKDRFNVANAISQYADYMNTHQVSVMRWAQAEMANEILSTIGKFADDIEMKLRLLSETLVAVATLLADEQAAIAGKLLDADEGGIIDAVSINGYNLLGKSWRDNYLASQQRTSDALLTNMCSGAWDPGQWLQSLEAPDAKLQIAQDVYDRIWEIDTGKVCEITISEVFRNEGKDAEQSLSLLLSNYVSPQLRFTEMESRYGQRPLIGFIGNVDDVDTKVFKEQQGLLALSKATAYEQDTICYLTVATQVALHGCDDLCHKIGPTFETWKAEAASLSAAERKLQWRLHYGFAGPDTDYDTWRLPTDRRREFDQVTTMIGRCYALSVILDPERFGPSGLNDESIHERLSAAVKAMHQKNPTPKEKRLGLFRLGKSDFYLTPFFDVTAAKQVKRSGGETTEKGDVAVDRPYAKAGTGSRGATTDATFVFVGVESPISLGKNIESVKAALLGDASYRESVKKWVEWFEANRSHFFTDAQLDAALIDARASALEMHVKQTAGSEAQAIWSAIADDIQTIWRESLL
jgi:hypothetical protein